jgi:hypothetical protein
MDHDIESFLIMMDEMLAFDIIKYIVSMISNEKNMLIIQRQKIIKKKINKDVIKLFNTYYYDNNFLVYKNEHNQFILQNISLNNKHISVYKKQHQENNQLMLTNGLDNENEIILFEENRDNEIYDENGLPVIRRIRLDIVYT